MTDTTRHTEEEECRTARYRLRNVVFDEVSGVDKGDNPEARVLLLKRLHEGDDEALPELLGQVLKGARSDDEAVARMQQLTATLTHAEIRKLSEVLAEEQTSREEGAAVRKLADVLAEEAPETNPQPLL
jgi:hypothetical protein